MRPARKGERGDELMNSSSSTSQVEQDREHYRDDVKRNPAPLVLLRQRVLHAAAAAAAVDDVAAAAGPVDQVVQRVRDPTRRHVVEDVLGGAHRLKEERTR